MCFREDLEIKVEGSDMSDARHILGLSGGKDSTALAVFMRDRVPDMEYVFTDTGKELPETYDYLKKVEAYLGKPVIYLNAERGFDHHLETYGNYLPSAQARWCTRKLKIIPFEKYVGDGEVYSYVGIRADENRSGYISTKPNIKPLFPFKEHGITKDDVYRILEETGLGMPEYYKWRTRSGCFFCFFQRRSEWVGLKENHPELYEEAKAYEKTDPETGKRYTWSRRESLDELEQPERMEEIKANQKKMLESEAKKRPGKNLVQILTVVNDYQDEDDSCLICHL
jgi:3'-phosphoadenosine 5'-phosphosulfate sulfotransferase (PAPS reductase)/FAD synthetase